MDILDALSQAISVSAKTADAIAEKFLGEYVVTSHILNNYTTMLPSGYAAPMRVTKIRVHAKRARWPFKFGSLPFQQQRVVIHIGCADAQPFFSCGHCQSVVDGYTHGNDNATQALAAASADLLLRQIQCNHVTILTKA